MNGPAAAEGVRPLAGRVALVTGVSRAIGIAPAIVGRLHGMGATVVASGWPAHDREMPWGEGAPAALPAGVHLEERNLADPAAPAALVDAVIERCDAIDIVVATHARSSDHGLADLDAAELDRCWATNVRSIVLLAQCLLQRRDRARPGGRVVWFTSGQHRGAMAGELPYAISKGALHQLTMSLADALLDAGIVANCINPGPVDTGWADPATHAAVAARFPLGRWGTPDDVANLVAFLCRDEGGWVVGQVLDSEGGFRR